MKNITVLLGSPRENGNSDKLAKAFMSGAKKAGNQVNDFNIRDMTIGGCIGCEYCYDHFGQCSQHDEMLQIYENLNKTDILVIVSPVYFQGFPSQLKAVIDRLYVAENRLFPISSAILLITYATPGDDMGIATIDYFKRLLKYHGWNNEGIIAVSGLDGRDDIVGNMALEYASQIGESII